MKTIDTLVREYRRGTNYKRVGNHCLKQEGNTTKFYYHNTAICTLDKTGKATYDNGGWGTSSTTRAINCYKKYFD